MNNDINPPAWYYEPEDYPYTNFDEDYYDEDKYESDLMEDMDND